MLSMKTSPFKDNSFIASPKTTLLLTVMIKMMILSTQAAVLPIECHLRPLLKEIHAHPHAERIMNLKLLIKLLAMAKKKKIYTWKINNKAANMILMKKIGMIATKLIASKMTAAEISLIICKFLK